MEPILAEAPAPIRDLHDRVRSSTDRDGRFPAAVRDAFSRNPLFTGLSVVCASERCEVHGTATADETRTRMAIREDGFLDRLSRLGLTSGMDMVLQGGAGSEFVVYLDRTPPTS